MRVKITTAYVVDATIEINVKDGTPIEKVIEVFHKGAIPPSAYLRNDEVLRGFLENATTAEVINEETPVLGHADC